VAKSDLLIVADTILDMLIEYLPDERRAELPDGLRAELRAELLAGLPAVPDESFGALVDDVAARLRTRGALERTPKAGAAESSDEAEALTLRALRVVSEAARVWPRFGRFLPSHAKVKFYGPDLAEHVSDFYEALATAETQHQQDRLIYRYTAAAFGKALACAGVAFRCRLRDEFNSLTGLVNGRGMESPSTPRDSS
jgi:hypothetical protein